MSGRTSTSRHPELNDPLLHELPGSQWPAPYFGRLFARDGTWYTSNRIVARPASLLRLRRLTRQQQPLCSLDDRCELECGPVLAAVEDEVEDDPGRRRIVLSDLNDDLFSFVTPDRLTSRSDASTLAPITSTFDECELEDESAPSQVASRSCSMQSLDFSDACPAQVEMSEEVEDLAHFSAHLVFKDADPIGMPKEGGTEERRVPLEVHRPSAEPIRKRPSFAGRALSEEAVL